MNRKKRKGYRTYVTSRPFGGFSIPVAVQNVFLRNYANQKDLIYMLPVNEFMFPNCFIQLEAAIGEIEDIEGLLMCSIFMLPAERGRRRRIYERVYSVDGAIHFAIEQRAIINRGDEEDIEEIFDIHQTLELCPSSLPVESLPALKYSTVL